MASNWLDDFVDFSNFGETSPKILYWVGVATIAGALRRKVWISQVYFQWTPNFYLLIVGPPGSVKKSTSIDMGLKFLRRVPNIDFGPQSVTWQQLVTHMAGLKESFTIADTGEIFEASCCTIPLSEFGTFFDPANRDLVDNLTDLWDSKIGIFKKETKTNGNDEVVNPWINIMACTTPAWIGTNFSAKLIRTGFASRPIYIYENRSERDVAYPSRVVPPNMDALEDSLFMRLLGYSELSGEFRMTEEAYQWGTAWYGKYRQNQRAMPQRDAEMYERKQTHLHKLAMVICTARGGFPTITAEDIQEAAVKLDEIEPDIRTIFGFVGQTKITSASNDISEVLSHGPRRKSELYRKHFARTMTSDEFELALKGVQAAGEIVVEGPLEDLIVRIK